VLTKRKHARVAMFHLRHLKCAQPSHCFLNAALMLNLARNVGADAESSCGNNEEKDEG
jgi:hypothetical protein